MDNTGKRKFQPHGSPSRSRPYTRRNPNKTTGAWNGVYNILGLVFPGLKTEQDFHVRLTNRVCEQHAI